MPQSLASRQCHKEATNHSFISTRGKKITAALSAEWIVIDLGKESVGRLSKPTINFALRSR